MRDEYLGENHGALGHEFMGQRAELHLRKEITESDFLLIFFDLFADGLGAPAEEDALLDHIFNGARTRRNSLLGRKNALHGGE
jgi:hypothetical protein